MRSIHQLNIIHNDFADIMKKEWVTASRKTETITKRKTIDFGEDLPFFSLVSNVHLENLNPFMPGGNKKVTHTKINLQLKAVGLSMCGLFGTTRH